VPAYTEETAFGAFHTGEVPYAYDNLYKVNRPYEETDRTLSSRMSSYWVHFTKTGDPNGAGLPTWPAFDNQQQQVLILDSKVEAVTLPTKNKLNFLEGYYRSLSKSEK
jgi:para-nitrobenzyl esterase